MRAGSLQRLVWFLAHAQAHSSQFVLCRLDSRGINPYEDPALHIPTGYISFLDSVRWVCWGRSLQSITSCSLLLDSSSVDYIPLTVPTASCSHTCCWLFYCSSQICSSCFETLQWERTFIKLAQMDIGLWLLHVIRVVQRNQCVNAAKLYDVCMQRECIAANCGAFRERHSLLTSSIHERTHWRNFFLVLPFNFP